MCVRVLGACALALSLACLLACEAQAPKDLTGRWKLSSEKLGGFLEVKDDGTYVYIVDRYKEEGTVVYPSPNKDPKEVHFDSSKKKKGEAVAIAIYKVDKQGTLALCIGRINKQGPTVFESDPKNGYILWKGVK
jgi:uncharacterized protein (TIGR03067 family)